MFKVLYAPAKAVEDATKHKKMSKTILSLVIGSVFFALSTMISLLTLRADGTTILITTISMAVGSFLLILLQGWLLQIVMNIFTKHVKFYDTLTGVSFGMLIIGTGTLLSGIFGLIPMIGIFLSAIVMIFAFLITYPVMIKSVMNLTKTDMLTTIVALIIVTLAIFFAAYSIAGQLMLATTPGLAAGY